MTREEKARAYDEALKKARFYHGNCPSEPERKKLEGMFPVLRVSEDERIRKFLVDYAIEMIAGLESDISLSTYDGIKGHDPDAEAELTQWQKARAYLEKQKEQKPVEFTHHETNESLKDAVTHQMEDDGDIDYFVRNGIDDIVLKYAKLGAKWQKEQKPDDDPLDDPKFLKGFDTGREVQRIFDERKPAVWSEEDKEMLLSIINAFRNGTVSTIGQEQWLKSLPKRFNLEPKQEWSDYKDKVNVPYCSSEPEWSEEDEDNLCRVIRVLEDNDSDWKELSNWLKSLRPSWKPSEDEERLINTSISFLKDFADKGYENAVECIDWLKSKLNGNSC